MTSTTFKVNPYHHSPIKRVIDFSFSLILLIILSPIFIIISLTIKLTSLGPVFFTQLRTGLNQKPFKFYKFRTMKLGSEKLQTKLMILNQADGPVFKIKNDPRFTLVGKIFSQSGLDELPQLLNIIMGNMSLVGPRPLPILEAKKLTPYHQKRHLIKPGITSTWVTLSPHSIPFKQWMKLDLNYVTNASFKTDINIMFKTALYLLKLFYRLI